MKNEILQAIYDYFDWVDCASCRFDEKVVYKDCDGCSPRTINWAISKDVAECFANKIMKIIKEENYE